MAAVNDVAGAAVTETPCGFGRLRSRPPPARMGTTMPRFAVLVVLVVAAFGLTSCGGEESVTTGDRPPSDSSEEARDDDAPSSKAPSEAEAPPSGVPEDALGQMEIAFEGNPSQEEIKADLDKALRLYELRATEENYSRAGSALVGLRKEFGVPEMQMLRYAIRLQLDTPGVNLDLPSALGLAAADLKTR